MTPLLGKGRSRARDWTRAAREVWAGVDPDLSRLRLASRAVLTLGGSLLLLLALSAVLPLTSGGPMIGSVFGMLGGLFVTDVSRRAQWGTFALLPLAAAAALALGTFAGAHPSFGVLAFVPTIFLTIWIHRFGPRGMALGMAAFNGFFFALFFRAQPGALPGLALSIVIGVGLAAVVRFVVLPEAPHRNVRRSLRAFPPLIGGLMRDLAQAMRSDTAPRVKRVRASLARVNQTALSLEANLVHAPEDRLEDGKRNLRSHVFNLEIAAGRVVSGIAELIRAEEVTDGLRAEVASALLAVRSAMHGEANASAQVRTHLAEAARIAGTKSKLSVILTRLAVAFDEVLEASELSRSEATPTGPELPIPPPPPERGLLPSTRQAIQATVAAGVAMIVGRWISPDWWFLAVLAAYLVVVRMPSRGAILLRAWQRAAGTVAGVAIGILLAAIVTRHRTLELVLLFAFVFVGFYALRSSYMVMVACFTSIVAILYSLLGRFSVEVLYLRLGETVAGAALGAAAAIWILPARTGIRIRLALSRVVTASADTLDAMADPAWHSERSLVRARQLDQALADLRTAAEPLTRSAFPIGRDTVDLVQAATTIVFYLRQLSGPDLFGVARREGGPALTHALGRLAVRLRAVDGWLVGQDHAGALTPVRPELAELRRSSAARGGGPAPDLEISLLWLKRIDAKLDEMAESLSH